MMVRPAVIGALGVVLVACAPALPGPHGTRSPEASLLRSTPRPVASADAVAPTEVESHLEALASIAEDNDGTRVSGTPGYDASVEYVAAELQAMGLQIERQEVAFTFFDEAAPVTVEIAGDSWTGAEWLHAMLYSASGDIAARAQAIGISDGAPAGSAGCDEADWSSFEEGGIALLMTGPCFRRQQVMLAQEAGAIGVIALYPGWGAGEIRRPTLVDPAGITVPVAVAGREPAEALLRAAADGERVWLRVDVQTRPAVAVNVLAEIAGTSDEVVMVGAHLDSVHDGPGMNDNASGVAVVLALAEAFAAQAPPERTVRFAFWAAEEFGVLGSTHYVESLSPAERARVVAYLNVDMVGSPNAGAFVYDEAQAAAGSEQLTNLLLSTLEGAGAPGHTIDIRGSSDHGPFQRDGIPTGGVFSGASDPLSADDAPAFGGRAGEPMDPCYHLSCDGLQNVDVDSAALFGEALAAALAALTGAE